MKYIVINGHPVPARVAERWSIPGKMASACNRTGDLAVLLDTRISPELYLEGVAAEVQRKISEARKAGGLSLEATPGVMFGTSDWDEWWAITCFRNEILRQTHCSSIIGIMSNEPGISLIEKGAVP